MVVTHPHTAAVDDRRRLPVPLLVGLLRRFAVLAGVNLGLLALLVFGLLGRGAGLGTLLAFGLYLVVNAVLLWGLIRNYPHARLGLCNIVTHFRATLIAGLAAVLPNVAAVAGDPFLAWSVVAIATIALACDGIDGWAARRAGLISRFGARFDMEVDSVLALILARIVMQMGKVGEWVILLGIMRYLFVVATWVFPWLNRSTPARFSGKVMCVIQIAALTALIAPVVSGGTALLIAAGALAGVVWSFGVDIRYLWKTRAA
ncbi:CDP-alcohol phosphatidyltransferase family protein [Yoonia sp.]|uniref:CDP-alcohol phosphatidyltransferase family protein n=1 Tax=Yoonia sp. TaxID=2212373 RepID=UPI00391A8192